MKKNIILRVLFIVVIVGVVLGLLFISIVSEQNKILIKESVDNYFININDLKVNYLGMFFKGFISNVIVVLFLWILQTFW